MRRTIMAALALSLLTSSLAMADPPWDRGHGDGDHHEMRHDDRDHRDWHHEDHDRRHDHDRRDHDRREQRDWHRDRFDAGYYQRPHGYYIHRWRRGERLPIAFRAPAYVIPDVAVYHLRPPPPGYYWVRVDNNAVLTAVATGVVVSVSLNLFH